MEQEKSFETANLLIKGNLIIWDKMLIQISSIAYLSEAPLDKLPFPKWSLLPAVFGIYVFTINVVLGFVILCIAIGWLLIWLQINKMRQEKRILTIGMNSGERMIFRFNDKTFLHKAMKVLEAILINGGLGSKNVVINIKDNKFSGTASFLNNMKA